MATAPSAGSSGVGSLDVPTLVSQLMAVERRPIDKLNARISSYQTKISSYGTLSGLVSSLQSSLQTLNTSLQGFSAVSSNSAAVSAAATSQAVAGTYSVEVSKLAYAQSLAATGQASSTAAIGTGAATTITFDFGTIDISATNSHGGGSLTSGVYTNADFIPNGSGSKTITIDGTNNTLQGIRDAINAARMGVTATIVNDGSATPYRLVLTSDNSGVTNSIKITTDGGDASIDALLAYAPDGLPAAQHLNQSVAAQNAEFTVNRISVSAASNVVTDAIQGVTLTLNGTTAVNTPASLTVARDTSAVSKAVSGFVEAYNALVSKLKTLSAYGSDSSSAPALAGDGTLRLMLDQLRDIFNTPAAGGTMTALAQVGITSVPGVGLKLDSAKLGSVMADDFADVANLFSSATGFATRLIAWSKSVTEVSGLLDTRTKSLNTSIKDYNSQISRLEVRMKALEKQYTVTYSNLNVLLANMNKTSNYLTQQFSKGSSS